MLPGHGYGIARRNRRLRSHDCFCGRQDVHSARSLSGDGSRTAATRKVADRQRCYAHQRQDGKTQGLFAAERFHIVSERIAYGKMESESLLEGYIEVMTGAVAVGCMESVTQITAYHEHTYIHTQSDTCAES